MKNTYAKDKYSVLRWMILLFILIGAFLTNIKNPALAILLYVLPSVFCLMHGSRFLGKRNIAVFLALIVVVSYTAEYLGTHTGVIFGQYYYNTVGNGPLLFGVPPLLMLTYFSIAYSSYLLIRIILQRFDLIKGWMIVGFSVCVAMLMTLTDLAADPVNSTINQVYIWTNGGAFFGVPYLNFIGWLAETFIFSVLVSLYLGYVAKSPKLNKTPSKKFLFEPIMLFSVPVLATILRPLWEKQWSDIYQSMSLIALFGLGIVIILAIVKVTSSKRVYR